MTLILRDVVGALFQLVPVVILAFFIWAAITISKQLDRIEALLTEIRNGRPSASVAD